jgi:hypothetical protein
MIGLAAWVEEQHPRNSHGEFGNAPEHAAQYLHTLQGAELGKGYGGVRAS